MAELRAGTVVGMLVALLVDFGLGIVAEAGVHRLAGIVGQLSAGTAAEVEPEAVTEDQIHRMPGPVILVDSGVESLAGIAVQKYLVEVSLLEESGVELEVEMVPMAG